jgi:hypothetical protein
MNRIDSFFGWHLTVIDYAIIVFGLIGAAVWVMGTVK